MRLRHRNFCAALLATVRASNSCACLDLSGIAGLYAERLVTYRVSRLYRRRAKRFAEQISTRPLVALRFEGAYHFLAHVKQFTENCLSAKKYHFLPSDKSGVLKFSR